jgi:hypothetical protein
MWKFTLESTHFIFNRCPIYTHDGASSKFRTNSQETDYSAGVSIFNKDPPSCFHEVRVRIEELTTGVSINCV